jgi:hypothetical protein
MVRRRHNGAGYALPSGFLIAGAVVGLAGIGLIVNAPKEERRP